MKAFLIKYFGWLVKSNRGFHIAAGCIISAIFGIIPALVAATVSEFKDWAWKGAKGLPINKNGFDWLDIAAVTIGAALSALIFTVLKNPYEYSFLTGFF